MQAKYLGFSILGILTVLFCLWQIFTKQVCCWPVAFVLFLFWSYGIFLLTFGWIKFRRIQIKQWLLLSPVRFFYLAIVVFLSIILYFDFFYLFLPENTLDFKRFDNILVESHGLLFDILLFGIGIAFYDEIRGKRMTKKRYKEELEDYRGWSDNEAAFRVAGIIKRLKEVGETSIDLKDLHIGRLALQDRLNCISNNIEYGSLTDAYFNGEDLSQHTFKSRIPCQRMNLRNTALDDTKFLNVYMEGSYLTSAQSVKTDFRHAFMNEAQMGRTPEFKPQMQPGLVN